MAEELEIPAAFVKVFALEPDEVTALVEKVTRAQYQLNFQPIYLLALKERMGKEFDKALLFKIVDHKNADNLFLISEEFPYLRGVKITGVALEKLLDDSTFWQVLFSSPRFGVKELERSELLEAYFNGAYYQAMERREQSTPEDLIPRGFTRKEMYPRCSKLQKPAQQKGKVEPVLGN